MKCINCSYSEVCIDNLRNGRMTLCKSVVNRLDPITLDNIFTMAIKNLVKTWREKYGKGT